MRLSHLLFCAVLLGLTSCIGETEKKEDSGTSGKPDAGWGDPIPGLAVSAGELRAFVGGHGGVLVWVNAGGQINMLDFSAAEPVVQTINSEPDHINPIISPDGTRMVYSQGVANGSKRIYIKTLPDGSPTQVGTGDIGFWHFAGGEEYVIYCDWSAKPENGADGQTYQQQITNGGVTLEGTAQVLHNRAMDGGTNASLTWLGQVYGNLWAYDVVNDQEYATDKFFLLDDSVADHQTCNGSMAPDQSAQLMVLVIPHDWVRIFSYQSSADRFQETSRFLLPPDMVEWEFPEWSSSVDYFTAVLRKSDYKNRLFVVKNGSGSQVPQVLQITDESSEATYSHLYIAP